MRIGDVIRCPHEAHATFIRMWHGLWNDVVACYSRRVKLPHNLMERRYRNHVNRQIAVLRLTVPVLNDDRLATESSVFAFGFDYICGVMISLVRH